MKIPRQPKPVGVTLKARLHNRRVLCRQLDNGHFDFLLKRFDPEVGFVSTPIRLSPDALDAMHGIAKAVRIANKLHSKPITYNFTSDDFPNPGHHAPPQRGGSVDGVVQIPNKEK